MAPEVKAIASHNDEYQILILNKKEYIHKKGAAA